MSVPIDPVVKGESFGCRVVIVEGRATDEFLDGSEEGILAIFFGVLFGLKQVKDGNEEGLLLEFVGLGDEEFSWELIDFIAGNFEASVEDDFDLFQGADFGLVSECG